MGFGPNQKNRGICVWAEQEGEDIQAAAVAEVVTCHPAVQAGTVSGEVPGIGPAAVAAAVHLFMGVPVIVTGVTAIAGMEAVRLTEGVMDIAGAAETCWVP